MRKIIYYLPVPNHHRVAIVPSFFSLSLLAALFILPNCNYGDNTRAPVAALEPSIATGDSTIGIVPTFYSYQIINTFIHDSNAFTQGLAYQDGFLYEGTGPPDGQGSCCSTLRQVSLETGEVRQVVDLEPGLFGEGITIVGERIFQLTWQSGRGFVYDRGTLAFLHDFTYATEGWGLTYDGERLIMSDGSPTLHFIDPKTFAHRGSIEVNYQSKPVHYLNELEYIEGEVFANVWQTDRIARINPGNGQVTGWVDLDGLLLPEDRQRRVDVLNGIAYDAITKRIFVTGKWWPKLFEITLVPTVRRLEEAY